MVERDGDLAIGPVVVHALDEKLQYASLLARAEGLPERREGIERRVDIEPGQTVPLGDYEIRHDGLLATEDWQKQMITGQFAVLRDGEVVDNLDPARWWYFQMPEQPTTEVSRHMSIGEDVYLSMMGADLTTGKTQLRMFINPLVNWVWIGTAIMLLGAAICIGTRRQQDQP